MSEPRTPSRTRLVRPDLFRAESTGRLSSLARDIYLGLATVSDDAGWLLWRPAAIAATILPYRGPTRAQRDLDRAREDLVAVGLLVLHQCGCAYLPSAARDLFIKGGQKARVVADYHESHVTTDQSFRAGTDPSRDSSSGSSSDSESGSPTGPRLVPGPGVALDSAERRRRQAFDGVLAGEISLEVARPHLFEGDEALLREQLGRRESA
jgi:hypothetical protein